jgi:hypothetical protein
MSAGRTEQRFEPPRRGMSFCIARGAVNCAVYRRTGWDRTGGDVTTVARIASSAVLPALDGTRGHDTSPAHNPKVVGSPFRRRVVPATGVEFVVDVVPHNPSAAGVDHAARRVRVGV